MKLSLVAVSALDSVFRRPLRRAAKTGADGTAVDGSVCFSYSWFADSSADMSGALSFWTFWRLEISGANSGGGTAAEFEVNGEFPNPGRGVPLALSSSVWY